MRVLGIYGSPRKRGNTERLHDMLLKTLEERGGLVKRIRVHDVDVEPCLEYTACEKTGRCPIEDDMETVVIPALRRADLVIVSTPVFFYGVPAGLKSLIDRAQILWARKNRLNLRDPAAGRRRGFLLAAGATTGERLFTGIRLTVEYFFDAIDAEYVGDLAYRSVEGRRDIETVDTLADDLESVADTLFRETKRRILVVSPQSGARALAASAALREVAGEHDDLASLGPAVDNEERRALDEAGKGAGIDLLSLPLDYRPDRDVVSDGWAPGEYDFTVTLASDSDAAVHARRFLENSGISGGRMVEWDPARGGEVGAMAPFLTVCREEARNFLDSLG